VNVYTKFIFLIKIRILRNLQDDVCRKHLKGVPARESRTGTRLVSPAASSEKKKMTPAEQGLATSNLVH